MRETPSENLTHRLRRLSAYVAADRETVRAAQALRYRVFAGEMGARLHSQEHGLDCDEFDDFCEHLVVVDRANGQIVGCTRLLSDRAAARLGRYYSEGEFELENVLGMPGRFLEIGRTCVDSAYRGGLVIGALWTELAAYVSRGRFDYLMGCASISPGPSGFAVDAVYRQLTVDQLGSSRFRVKPRRPVPEEKRCGRDESGIPPLLQAYLRLGAWVCGEPCWDPDFDVMDVFVLLSVDRLTDRYERRFIGVGGGHRAAVASVV